LVATGKAIAVSDTLPAFVYQFLIQFGVITLIFTFADRHWSKFPDRWNPRGLNHPWHQAFVLPAGWKGAHRSGSEPVRVSALDSVAQFVALGVTIGWLRAAQRAPFMILGPAAAFIKVAPIWHQFYWPIVAIALAGMAQAGINLLRPDWVRLRTAYQMLSAAMWLVISLLLLRAGNWIVVPEAGGPLADSYHHTAIILNQCLTYVLIGVSMVAAYGVFHHLRRLVRRAQTPSSSSVPHERGAI
jgi:hypothetical protein